MARAQKPDFVFRRKGRVHLNRRGASVQSTTGSRGVRISGSNAGYTMFRGSVKGTGYPLHSPVSPSLPLLCVTVCHHISNAVYHNPLPLQFWRDVLFGINYISSHFQIDLSLYIKRRCSLVPTFVIGVCEFAATLLPSVCDIYVVRTIKSVS